MNKQEFREAASPKTRLVPMPDSDKSLCIRQLSAEEYVSQVNKEASNVSAAAEATEPPEIKNVRTMAQAIAISAIDEATGQLLFDESDIPDIMKMSFGLLLHLTTAINELNRLTGEVKKN